MEYFGSYEECEKHMQKEIDSFKGCHIPDRVLRNEEISWMEKCLLGLFIQIFEKGGEFERSNKFLARMMNSNESSIKKAILNLKKNNLITYKLIDFSERRIGIPNIKEF